MKHANFAHLIRLTIDLIDQKLLVRHALTTVLSQLRHLTLANLIMIFLTSNLSSNATIKRAIQTNVNSYLDGESIVKAD